MMNIANKVKPAKIEYPQARYAGHNEDYMNIETMAERLATGERT